MEPCNAEVFKNGTMVAMVVGPRSTTIDPWVAGIAKATGQAADWHMAGGRAIVLAIGDLDAVREAIRNGKPDLVAAYLAATNNWSKNPQAEDVRIVIYGDEGKTARDVAPHVLVSDDGRVVLVEPR